MNEFYPSSDHLDPTIKKLVEDLKEAVDKNQYRDAWSLIEYLLSISNQNGGKLEIAQVRVECGMAVYNLGYLGKSAELFKEAVTYYQLSSHHRGVALWLLGNVLWSLDSNKDEAVGAWRRSIQVFSKIPAHNRFLSKKELVWYKNLCRDLQAELEKTVRLGSL